jgi:Zn finger protein HypA/HybF involved in hydrogenase expression
MKMHDKISLMATPDVRAKVKATKVARTFQRLIESPFDMLGQRNRKRRVLHEQDYKCLECKISEEWNGKPLALHLDHIDGNHDNNTRDNLRCLCPNCHSQTHTYAGRNWGVNKERQIL